MHANSAAAAPPPSKSRSRTVSRPYKVAGLNAGSAPGRRFRDECLVSETALRRQGIAITADVQSKIARAVRLKIIAADMGAAHLRGEPLEPVVLVKVENLAARAWRELGIKQGGSTDNELTLAEYLVELAQRAGGASAAAGDVTKLDEADGASKADPGMSPTAPVDPPSPD